MAKCWFNDLEVSESVIFAFLDFGYTTWKKLLQLQISHLYSGNKKEGCWGNRGLLGCVGHWVWCPEPCQKLSARKLMAPLLLGAASYRFLQDPTEQVPRKESVTEDRSRGERAGSPEILCNSDWADTCHLVRISYFLESRVLRKQCFVSWVSSLGCPTKCNCLISQRAGSLEQNELNIV